MKKIKEFINNNLLGLIVAVFFIAYTSILLIIFGIYFSDKYEDDIVNLEIENKKQEYKIARLKKDSKEKDGSIEDLQAQVDGIKAVECDCGWFQDFYYNHAEERGANE